MLLAKFFTFSSKLVAKSTVADRCRSISRSFFKFPISISYFAFLFQCPFPISHFSLPLFRVLNAHAQTRRGSRKTRSWPFFLIPFRVLFSCFFTFTIEFVRTSTCEYEIQYITTRRYTFVQEYGIYIYTCIANGDMSRPRSTGAGAHAFLVAFKLHHVVKVE